MSTGGMIFAVIYILFFLAMAIWPVTFYSISRAKGELTNGPLFIRILGIVMLVLPIAGYLFVKRVE